MEYDLLECIFEKLKLHDSEEKKCNNQSSNIIGILKFRLLDKTCNNIFQSYFKQINVDIISRATFIKMNECFICDDKITDTHKHKHKQFKQLIYKYDSPPHKCIIHCNNPHCYLSAIKRYLIDIKKNHIYPFCQETNKFIMDNYDILVNNKDTHNEKSNSWNKEIYYIETLRKYKNKFYIKLQYCMIFEKYFTLNKVDNIIDYNLFGWFLNRKSIHNNKQTINK